MAFKLALIVLACAIVAVCNAEAPFRGYSSRQQAAPYPASGFRPDRTFDLPTGEAIAQQLRLAQIKKLQQQYQQQQQIQQQQQQQQQQTPSQYYGTPSESEASQSQFPPQQPSGLYGAPQEEAASNLQPSDFTRPQQPSQQYGAPSEEALASQLQGQFLRPQQQQQTSQRQIQFQRQQQPSRQYGAPINKAIPESGESVEESKEVENVAALDKKSGRLTQGNQERDTENDEAETATKTATAVAATAVPAGYVLVPISAAPAGFTPQKLALLQASPAQAAFAKIQYPGLIGLPQQKFIAAPQLLAQQSYYQPQQQFAFASAPLQAW